MNKVPYSITETTITATINFIPKVIPKTHPNFTQIREALLDGADEATLEPLLSIPKAIEAFTDGDVLVKNGKLFYKGYEVAGALAKLILGFSSEGKEAAAAPFKAFLANAFSNPDPRAATDLYDWVVNSNLPITPDGHILAWKAVTENYGSIHSSRRRGAQDFDHHIGNTLEMDRTECDANPDNTCSTGLHFCSADYLPQFASGGSRIVALKINPADVVAFPRDYGWQKGRAFRYQVVGEVPLDQVKDFYPQGRRIHDIQPVAPPAAIVTGPVRNAKGQFAKKSA
jgi:hypothetical protein